MEKHELNIKVSLQECKEIFAEKYNKTWSEIQKDYEYGNGISKLWDFEDVMNMVAEIYLGENGKA